MLGSRERDGVAQLREALTSLGVASAIEVTAVEGRRADVVLAMADDHVSLETTALALADADTVAGRLGRWGATLTEGAVGLVVADRVTAAARDLLNESGWGWLDLRGHLRIVGPGIVIDTDVPATGPPAPARSAFSGQVGRELAVLLLLAADQAARIRAAAAELSRAPSSVSETMRAFRADGLVTTDRRPVLPELFWALGEHWESTHVDVASLPVPERDGAALGVNLADLEQTGWALTDTVAAVAYGAPVASRVDHPPDFLVPDQTTLRRAVQLLGPAATASTRAGRVRVAPVPAACSWRVEASGWTDAQWPLAHPLFVALDLAQDPGRGREILDGWTPPKPWRRVW